MTYAYKYQGQTIELTLDPDLIAVSFQRYQPMSARARAAKAWSTHEPKGGIEIPDEGIVVLPAKFFLTDNEMKSNDGLEETRESLLQQAGIANAWPVFDAGGHQIIVTNRLVVGLVNPAGAEALCQQHRLKIVETRDDKIVCEVSNAADLFNVIDDLDTDGLVRFVEPDFITIARESNDTDQISLQSHFGTEDEIDDQISDYSDDGTPETFDEQLSALEDLAETIGNSRKRMESSGVDSPLMAVRIKSTYLPGGRQKTTNSTLARSINWARNSGAHIITHSWIGSLPSSDILEEFERARLLGRNGLGCVMVAASDDDGQPAEFPASLPNMLVPLPYGLSNGAIPTNDAKHRQVVSGNSVASSTLSGSCAMILAANPNLTEAEVRELVLGTFKSAERPKNLVGPKDQSGKPRLDVFGAVQSALTMAH